MPKVNEQSYFFVTCNQIINQLPFMFWPQINYSLQFYNHLIFDYHIRDIVSNYLAFIKHIDWFLALTSHSTFCQLFIECITIHGL